MWCKRDNSSDYSGVVLGKSVLFQLFGSCLQPDYISHDDPERATGEDISCNHRPGSKKVEEEADRQPGQMKRACASLHRSKTMQSPR